MLKINNHTIYKYKVPLNLLLIACCSLALFSYLTFIPTYSSAADTTADQRTLMNIKYMQQMSEQICTNTKENKTKQLIDIRDGKSYWVTKLKDGNCWMTQNLDLDLTQRRLSSADSDVKEERVLNIESALWEGNTKLVTKWYNPGTYIYPAPQSWEPCDLREGMDSCLATGWKYLQINYPTTDGIEAWHYHIGNYYSWNAAVAGTGTELTGVGQSPSGSICPRGWHLPNYDDFHQLMGKAGIENSAEGVKAATGNPYYFVPSGRINRGGTGQANSVGSEGAYWTSVPNGGDYDGSAMYLTFGQTSILPAKGAVNGALTNYGGASVRCLAPGTGLDGNGNADETVWDDPDYPDLLDTNQANLAITVSPVISIDATSGMSSAVDFTTVALGDIKATVSSNQAYQVLLSTNQSTLEQDPMVANQNIPMVEQDTTITTGTRAWGVKKTNSVLPGGILGDSSTNTNLTYSPIGINNDKVLFYQSQGAESKTIIFPVAISIDSTLPSGVYSTMVTITAVGS